VGTVSLEQPKITKNNAKNADRSINPLNVITH
jgi:hypothetical protein